MWRSTLTLRRALRLRRRGLYIWRSRYLDHASISNLEDPLVMAAELFAIPRAHGCRVVVPAICERVQRAFLEVTCVRLPAPSGIQHAVHAAVQLPVGPRSDRVAELLSAFLQLGLYRDRSFPCELLAGRADRRTCREMLQGIGRW